jgi:hypothetical protein
MDFIYSRLNNNLVDINRIDTITLLKCEKQGSPIESLNIGDYYLKVTVVDSDKVNYCDLSDLNKDEKELADKIYEEQQRAINRENEVEKTSANYLEIEQDEKTGIVSIKLLNIHGDILDTKELDLETEKIIRSVDLDYENKKLVFHLVDGTDIETDLSECIDDFNNKLDKISEDLSAESRRAEDVENLLTENLNKEISERKKDDTLLQTNIDNENKRAVEAETLLQSNLDNESSIRENKDKELNDNLSSEISRAKNKEEEISTNLSNEITRAKESENTLQSNINKEAQTRKEQDDILTNSLNEEINRAKEKEDSINNDLHTNYVDLSNEQVITGKKLFRTGNTTDSNVVYYDDETVFEKKTTIKAGNTEKANVVYYDDETVFEKGSSFSEGLTASREAVGNYDISSSSNEKVLTTKKYVDDNLKNEASIRKYKDDDLQSQITSNDTDIANLQSTKADIEGANVSLYNIDDSEIDNSVIKTSQISNSRLFNNSLEGIINTSGSTYATIDGPKAEITNWSILNATFSDDADFESAKVIISDPTTKKNPVSLNYLQNNYTTKDYVDGELDTLLEYIDANTDAIDINKKAIEAEVSRATSRENELSSSINALNNNLEQEAKAREDKDSILETKIDDEINRAKNKESELNNSISTINTKIPTEASSTNLLADRNWVNVNAGKIDSISVESVQKEIVNKNVNLNLSDFGIVLTDKSTPVTITEKTFSTISTIFSGDQNGIALSLIKDYDLLVIRGYKEKVASPNKSTFILTKYDINNPTQWSSRLVANEWEYTLRLSSNSTTLFFYSTFDYSSSTIFKLTDVIGIKGV